MTSPFSISLADGQHIHIHLGTALDQNPSPVPPLALGARRRPLVLATAAVALFAAGYVVHDGTMPAVAQPMEIASLSPESLAFQPPPSPSRLPALAPGRAVSGGTAPIVGLAASGPMAAATKPNPGEPRPPAASFSSAIGPAAPTVPAARPPAAAQNAFGLE